MSFIKYLLSTDDMSRTVAIAEYKAPALRELIFWETTNFSDKYLKKKIKLSKEGKINGGMYM